MFLKPFAFIVCCLIVVVIEEVSACGNNIISELTYRLSGNNIEFPCESTKNIYITTGRYTPRNVIPTRAQIHKDEAFIAMPRYKSGIPITLGRISLKKGESFSSVLPYPCWSIQEEGNCQSFQSIVDIFIDSQDILWVLDVGIVNTLEQPIKRCAPKVVAINLKNGKIVQEIDLSSSTSHLSRLQYIVVDYDSDGRAFVYIADAGNRAILVHNCTERRSHRIVLPSAVSGDGENDVLYIALIRKSDGLTILYFTFLGSSRLYSIKAEHLRRGEGSGAVVDIGPKPSDLPIVLLGTDNGASLFVRYKGLSDIYLWNTETAFKSSNFLEVQRGGECRLATHVMPGSKHYMWTIESNFHDYIADTVGCNGASVIIHPVVRECDD